MHVLSQSMQIAFDAFTIYTHTNLCKQFFFSTCIVCWARTFFCPIEMQSNYLAEICRQIYYFVMWHFFALFSQSQMKMLHLMMQVLFDRDEFILFLPWKFQEKTSIVLRFFDCNEWPFQRFRSKFAFIRGILIFFSKTHKFDVVKCKFRILTKNKIPRNDKIKQNKIVRNEKIKRNKIVRIDN